MRVGLICQYFPPEVMPIGHMLSELANDLVKAGHAVTVFTGYPNHPGGTVFAGYQSRLAGDDEQRPDGVLVRRNWLYTSPSRSIFARLLNYASFAVSTLVSAMARKQDIYLIVSPPITNFVIGFVLRLFGRRYVLNVQDIFPDAAIAIGMVHNPALIRVLFWIESQAYRLSEAIVVISNGFEKNLLGKGVPRKKVAIVPNWVDPDEIQPRPKQSEFSRQQGVADQFTVLYSGNIGLVSGVEIIPEMASLLQDQPDIAVLMVGDGAMKAQVVEEVQSRRISNVRFAPFQPRAILPDVLSSASVSLVMLKPGYGGNSVPSKILSYLAAARPVIAAVDQNSDTWQFVEEAQCGICIPPGDARALADAVLRLRSDPELCLRLGQNGRRYLEQNLCRNVVTPKYMEILCARR